jgi:hypothetical protein
MPNKPYDKRNDERVARQQQDAKNDRDRRDKESREAQARRDSKR